MPFITLHPKRPHESFTLANPKGLQCRFALAITCSCSRAWMSLLALLLCCDYAVLCLTHNLSEILWREEVLFFDHNRREIRLSTREWIMPSFIHKTLLRASHVMNVIEGEWIPSCGHRQYLLHYGTSFEIVEFDESSKSLSCIFWQPLFAKVQFVCDGPVFGKYSSFLAFRKSDILVLCYSEAERLFIAKKQFVLPESCFNASFGFFCDSFIVASSKLGGLCSIQMHNGSSRVLEERVKGVVSCFRYNTNKILRIEEGGRVSIYECPMLALVFREIYSEVKYAFPFGYNGYVLWNRDDMLVHVRGQSSYLDLPVEDLLNSPIGDAFLTYNYTVLLTREGNVLLFGDGNVESMCKYDNTYAVFRMTARRVLLCRHGMRHVVLDVEPQEARGSMIGSYRGMSKIVSARVINHRLELVSKSSVCFVEHGIAKRESSTAQTEGDITGVSAFKYGEQECIALTFGNQTSFAAIEDGRIMKLERGIRLDEDKRTLAVIPLQPDILVQVHEQGLILIRKDDVRVHDVERRVMKYTATQKQLVLLLKRGSPRYLLIDKTSSKTLLVKLGVGNGGRHTKVRCGVLVPESSGDSSRFFVFCDQTMSLQVAEIDVQHISDGSIRCFCQTLSKLEKYPTDLQFTKSMRMCIGFDDGVIVIANYDSENHVIKNDLVFRLGLASILFSSNLVIASRLCCVKETETHVDVCPIIGTANCVCCTSLASGAIVSGKEHTATVFSVDCLKEDDSFQYVKLPTDVAFRDVIRIAETSNYILAAPHLVEIYDIDDGEVEELVEFDTGETFATMLLTETRLVIASWHDRGSEIRVFKIGENHVVLSPPMQFVVNGTVQTIAEFHSGLLFGLGDTILFYLESGNRMQVISKTDGIGKNITTICTHGSTVYIGDRNMAVLALEYITERQKFHVTAQDTFIRSITCLCSYGDSTVAGDTDGSIVLYSLPRNMVHNLSQISGSFIARKAIPIRMSYCVGESITSVSSVGSQQSYSSLMYSTSLGTVGCFLENTAQKHSDHITFETALKRLKKLELELALVLEKLTKSDFIQFRNEILPCDDVVDLDLVNFYLRISDSQRERIASVVAHGSTPAMIDQQIDMANAYFKCVY